MTINNDYWKPKWIPLYYNIPLWYSFLEKNRKMDRIRLPSTIFFNFFHKIFQDYYHRITQSAQVQRKNVFLKKGMVRRFSLTLLSIFFFVIGITIFHFKNPEKTQKLLTIKNPFFDTFFGEFCRIILTFNFSILLP